MDSVVPIYQVITCKNPLCRTQLALTDGRVLIIAGLVMVEVTLPFFCWKCNEKYVWRPRDWVSKRERRERRQAERVVLVAPKPAAISAMIDAQVREKQPS